ncbi:hypothetical protein ECDEC6E_1861 [Escherichia coli DEC6E]|nr:hypothetical protein ECDEC6E_1861 [Escherichia coli DEC6E]
MYLFSILLFHITNNDNLLLAEYLYAKQKELNLKLTID